MVRKAVLLLLVLIGVIPVACCPEPVEGPYVLDLYQVTPLKEGFITPGSTAYVDYLPASGDTYAEDTLVLTMDFSYFIAQNSSNFSFQPYSFALSCDQEFNLKELSDKVESVTVTSNRPLNDIPAGESLNELIISFDGGYEAPIGLEQMKERINAISGTELSYNRALTTLAITEKPAIAQERTFTLTVTYDSGKKQATETFPITW